MGIADKGIVAVGKEVEDTALETIKTMLDDESELVTVYYGADVTEEQADQKRDSFWFVMLFFCVIGNFAL